MVQAAPTPAPEETTPALKADRIPVLHVILFTIIIAFIWAVIRQRAKNKGRGKVAVWMALLRAGAGIGYGFCQGSIADSTAYTTMGTES